MSINRKKKILYIEDDLSSRILVKKVLGKSDFEYFEAANGLEGLAKAKVVKPDLIIMDINLPDINGNELSTKIKNTPDLNNIIIVALTASTDDNIREMTLVAGCDGFIQKPIDVHNFPLQLMNFLDGKKEEISQAEKEYYRDQYEISLVEHLTNKVQELEESNQKLSNTSKHLQDHSNYLEKVLQISSRLQECRSSQELKKTVVQEICSSFNYDRCILFEVGEEDLEMKICYAEGIPLDTWEKYTYPFENSYFKNLFVEKQVIYFPETAKIEKRGFREHLERFKFNQFIFAYLGVPTLQLHSEDIRKNVLPMLEAFLPSLYNQESADIDIILGRLQEYLSGESLSHPAYVLLDNYRSQRMIASFEYHFLETLFRSCGYLYQNLQLMEKLRSLYVRAEKEAITDPLTELFNYRYFMDQLKREINRNQRRKSNFSLILIDIDFFKIYNDTFGHQTGDQILKRISKLLMENTRTSDIVARYGGEEFVVICPELNRESAHQVAEKLRQMVEKTEFPKIKDSQKSPLTISLGISTFPDDGETPYQLIKNADKALYRAKDSGRNIVCSSSN
jgi:diguanylate cyclase (GGDEF)-like protein